jgi:hypothetical protein
LALASPAEAVVEALGPLATAVTAVLMELQGRGARRMAGAAAQKGLDRAAMAHHPEVGAAVYGPCSERISAETVLTAK